MNYFIEILRRYRGFVGEGVFSVEDRMIDNVNLLLRIG